MLRNEDYVDVAGLLPGEFLVRREGRLTCSQACQPGRMLRLLRSGAGLVLSLLLVLLVFQRR